MKLTSVIGMIGAIALATTSLFAQQDEKKVILELEQTWMDAHQKYEPEALERLLRDDFIDVDQQGIVRSGRDLYQLWEKTPAATKAATAKLPKPNINAIRVRLYNAELAVVTGGVTQTGPKKTAYRFVRVWTKVNNEWRLSTNQATNVADMDPKPPKNVKIINTGLKHPIPGAH